MNEQTEIQNHDRSPPSRVVFRCPTRQVRKGLMELRDELQVQDVVSRDPRVLFRATVYAGFLSVSRAGGRGLEVGCRGLSLNILMRETCKVG